MKKACCRLWYRLRISEIDPAIRQKIVARMGADDAGGLRLVTDASGFQPVIPQVVEECRVRCSEREDARQNSHITSAARQDLRGLCDKRSRRRFPRRRGACCRSCRRARAAACSRIPHAPTGSGLPSSRQSRPGARHGAKIKRRRQGVWTIHTDAALPPGTPADALQETRAAQQHRGFLFGHKDKVWQLHMSPEESQQDDRAAVSGDLPQHDVPTARGAQDPSGAPRCHGTPVTISYNIVICKLKRVGQGDPTALRGAHHVGIGPGSHSANGVQSSDFGQSSCIQYTSISVF